MKANLKDFLSKTLQATHINRIKTYISCANILCGRLGFTTTQDNRTTVLIWDNGASF